MADLRVEHPRTTEAYVAALAEAGIRLPLHSDDRYPGCILDATGREIAVVDVNSEMSDANVTEIATWFILAVNTCGGFKADNEQVQP